MYLITSVIGALFTIIPITIHGALLDLAGPFTPTRYSDDIGAVPMRNCMNYKFDLVIDTFCTSNWCSVIHVGNDNSSSNQGNQRMPAIWMRVYLPGKFHMPATTIDSGNPQINVGPAAGLSLGTVYSFNITYDQPGYTVVINDEVIYENANWGNHCVSGDTCHGVLVADEVPIQIGQNGWYNELDGTISNLLITDCDDLCADVDCDDGDLCTDEYCDENTGECVYSDVDCTDTPSAEPSAAPTRSTNDPTPDPSEAPIRNPSETTTKSPTNDPTSDPSEAPTRNPSETTTKSPTFMTTKSSTNLPDSSLTKEPTIRPTKQLILIETSESPILSHKSTSHQSVEHEAEVKTNDIYTGILIGIIIIAIIAVSLCKYRCYEKGKQKEQKTVSEYIDPEPNVMEVNDDNDEIQQCEECGEVKEGKQLNGAFYCKMCRELKEDDIEPSIEKMYNNPEPILIVTKTGDDKVGEEDVKCSYCGAKDDGDFIEVDGLFCCTECCQNDEGINTDSDDLYDGDNNNKTATGDANTTRYKSHIAQNVGHDQQCGESNTAAGNIRIVSKGKNNTSHDGNTMFHTGDILKGSVRGTKGTKDTKFDD